MIASVIVSKRNGSISLQLNATNTEVYADRTHLLNIIYNLIDNALKYTMDIPEIIIGTSDHPQGVEISIKDNGIGMVRKFRTTFLINFKGLNLATPKMLKGLV
ncbi:sensor histidine kinase [Ekhidna sp.]|uniref:sensor histidine kinase n=1 Tax=Ekhidna sp. TaxID=2608089 RepID=UPI003B5065D5